MEKEIITDKKKDDGQEKETLTKKKVLVDYDDDEDEEQQKDKKKDEKNTSRQHVSLGINEQSFKKIREDTKSAQPDKHDSKYSTHSSSRDHNRRSPKKSPDFGRRRSRERSHRRDRSRSNERNRRVRRRSRSRDDDRRGKRDEEEGHHRSRENERRKNDHWRERRDEVRGSRPQETRSNERRRYQSPSSPSRRRRRRSSQDKTSNSSTHSDRTHSPPNQMLKGKTISFIGSTNQKEGSLRSGSSEASSSLRDSHDRLSTTTITSTSEAVSSSSSLIPPSSSVPVNLMATGIPMIRPVSSISGLMTRPVIFPRLIPPPVVVDNKKIVEDKRKLLWGDKDKSDKQKEKKTTVWDGLNFGSENKTEKFRKLMGIKSKDAASDESKGEASSSETKAHVSLVDKQKEIFQDLDKQYSHARSVTHAHRGTGLGFGS